MPARHWTLRLAELYPDPLPEGELQCFPMQEGEVPGQLPGEARGRKVTCWACRDRSWAVIFLVVDAVIVVTPK